MAETEYLPKDWDWAASPLTTGFPSLPYLVSSTIGGICDLIARDAPPLPRSAPNSGDVPKEHPDADSLLRAASDLVDTPDRAQASAAIRVPPATPKPPPPAPVTSDQDNTQATDVPSDYQSDWYGDWSRSDWKWTDHRYRS